MKLIPIPLILLSSMQRELASLAGELKPLLPGWIAGLLSSRDQRVILCSEPTGLRVSLPGPHEGGDTSIYWDAKTGTWTPPEGLRQLQSASRRHIFDLDVPQDMLLEQEIVLPKTAANNLNGAISFGLATWSPFSLDEVYLAAKIKATKEQRITVGLMYGLKTQLQTLIDHVESAGLVPDRLIFAGDCSWAVPINSSKLRYLQLLRRLDRLLLVTAVAFLTVLTGLIAHRQALELSNLQLALRSSLDSIRRDEAAERSLIEQEARRTIVVRRRSNERSFSQILSSVGAVLPSEAFLVSIDISGERGRLEVEGASAPDLIHALRRVEWVEQPKIDASPPEGPVAIVFRISRRDQ